MIERDQIVSEDELNAYVDGELPADRRGAVEAWLASHPDDAAKVAAWRKQAELIRARYGAVADEKPPQQLDVARLTRRRYGAVARRQRRPRCGVPRRRRRRLDRARRRSGGAAPISRSSPPMRSMLTGYTWSRSVTRSRCRATSGRICVEWLSKRVGSPVARAANSTRWD